MAGHLVSQKDAIELRPENSRITGERRHFSSKKPSSQDTCRCTMMMAEWLKPVQRIGDDLFVRSPAEDSGMRRDDLFIGGARTCFSVLSDPV